MTRELLAIDDPASAAGSGQEDRPRMDRVWTKTIESPQLNTPKMAKGEGFAPVWEGGCGRRPEGANPRSACTDAGFQDLGDLTVLA